jgi:NADPH:quinone reductase-like Zn-dependent oxidoreductase
MKAIVLKEFGGPENLSLDDLPIPSVEPGAVLIRAVAASANPVDVSISKGTPFSPVLPAALGCDVAGVVESVGDGVTGFAPGDEVFGCVGGVRGSGGTLAEYVLADAKLLARKPRMLSMREAAALPLVAITAHEGIDRAGVSSAHHVLVHGGTVGVGHVAVQIAAARGAKVSTTVSARSLAMAMHIGATEAIDYGSETVETLRGASYRGRRLRCCIRHIRRPAYRAIISGRKKQRTDRLDDGAGATRAQAHAPERPVSARHIHAAPVADRRRPRAAWFCPAGSCSVGRRRQASAARRRIPFHSVDRHGSLPATAIPRCDRQGRHRHRRNGAVSELGRRSADCRPK